MRRYSFDATLPPGTWSVTRDTDGNCFVWFACPTCGKKAILDHDIDADGTVTPSVVCPFEGCTFHEFVELEGWQE